uniref:Uncharacterized protein n=1 Tax=Oryza meridionalis TaxID=40149 RepID=A0A0E0F3Z0_9ORYZ
MEDAHLLLSPQGDCRLAAVAGRRRRRVRSGGIVPPGPVDGSARTPTCFSPHKAIAASPPSPAGGGEGSGAAGSYRRGRWMDRHVHDRSKLTTPERKGGSMDPGYTSMEMAS